MRIVPITAAQTLCEQVGACVLIFFGVSEGGHFSGVLCDLGHLAHGVREPHLFRSQKQNQASRKVLREA